MKTKTTHFSIIATFCLLASLAAACSQSPARHKKVIAVSIPPQKAIVETIVGDSADVVCLLSPDSNPETFEPSVADMRAISSADAYLLLGNMPFESMITSKMRQNSSAPTFYSVTDNIDLIYGTHSHCDHHDADQHHHDAMAADPHVWTSTVNLRKIVANTLDALESVDPDNIDFYRQNAQALTLRIDSIDADFRSRLDANHTRAFIIWHPSLSYLARDFSLQQIALGMENKEMSVIELNNVIHRARQSGADVMFVQRNFDLRQAQNAIDQLDIDRVETIDPMSPDVFSQLEIIANALSPRNPHN